MSQEPNRLLVLFGNQLFPDEHIALAAPDVVFMAESGRMCRRYRAHAQKLVLILSAMRSKADALGLKYHLRYGGGCMAGNDPTLMGMAPVPAAQKLLARKGLKADDIDVWELNEAFGTQALAVLRELGIEENAPFKKTNLWGGALALGHPLGESGCRVVVTLNSIMKKEKPDAKRGVAMLCGGFGNGNASLWEKV